MIFEKFKGKLSKRKVDDNLGIIIKLFDFFFFFFWVHLCIILKKILLKSQKLLRRQKSKFCRGHKGNNYYFIQGTRASMTASPESSKEKGKRGNWTNEWRDMIPSTWKATILDKLRPYFWIHDRIIWHRIWIHFHELFTSDDLPYRVNHKKQAWKKMKVGVKC